MGEAKSVEKSERAEKPEYKRLSQRMGQVTIKLQMVGGRKMPLFCPGHAETQERVKKLNEIARANAAKRGIRVDPGFAIRPEGALGGMVWVTAEKPVVFEMSKLDHKTRDHIDRALVMGHMKEV